MENKVQHSHKPRRLLRYRSHYKVYLISLWVISAAIVVYWAYQFTNWEYKSVIQESRLELWLSFCYFLSFGTFYFSWLKYRIHRSVQVFSSHLALYNLGKVEEVKFSDVESIGVVCWSVFYFKMKNGVKYYFSSSLERVDYVWESIREARPDLIPADEYEAFRTKLVQYDHHQKRKDWFFKHKLVDVFNWIVLPLSFLCIAYVFQSREVIIHQQGMYFFRLVMYSFLVILLTTFFYSFVLKKFVFDKKIKLQMNSEPHDKLRNIEFEGVVLHRSKLLQMITAVFFFALIVRTELNLYSITKIKEDMASFNLKSGRTLMIDNRFNCLQCKYSVQDGDLVVFGRGTIGQLMASEGDMVGQISQDTKGRIIASEQIHEVPKGHVAIKLANQREIVMVKLDELIGKIQK